MLQTLLSKTKLLSLAMIELHTSFILKNYFSLSTN